MFKYLLIILMFSSFVFSETTTSPNMSLPIPVVGTTPGPQWANNINSCMNAIDSHDHTPGYGVQIPPDGININSALTMNNYPLTNAQSIVFQNQASLSTLKAIYAIDGDLYYNDGSGNNIRITQSGSVAGASGTITGLPSGTASASYQSAGGTFQFQSATNTPANISGASILVQEQTATPNGITIKSPLSLAASYNLTLPTAVPAANSFLMMATTGALSTRTITAPTVQKFTSSSGTYTTPSGVLYIKVKMVGGGGGGCSGNAAIVSQNAGSNGGNTTFGSSLLTANGGTGGPTGQSKGGAGGTSTLNSPAVGAAFSGTQGGGNFLQTTSGATVNISGGVGGSSPFGGGGSTQPSGAGGDATTNSGSGGGGGGSNSLANNASGTGGGSGGYIEAIITSPSATYAYAVGSAGAGGSAGGGQAGGNGAAGIIIVEEYYQ